MILKPIQIVLDSSGNQIDLNYRPIRSHTSFRHIIQIVAPNLATEACDVTVSTYGKEIVSETTRTRLAVDANGTYLKGSAVVDEDEAYYSSVSEYNVWEVELVGPVASILQKVNSSKVAIVVSFSMPVVDARALVNVGSFGSSGDLPAISTETIGDYRVCDSLAYTSTLISTQFKYNDIAFYDGSTWVKGKVFRMIQTCPLIQLSVDPSLALMYDEPTDELAEVLIDDVARVDGIVSAVQAKVNSIEADNLNLNNDIAVLDAATALNTAKITFDPTSSAKLDGIEAGAQVNVALASQAEAEAGLDNTKTMTPLRVKQAIVEQITASGDVLTTLSLTANTLTYTDEEGLETNLDLSLYLDDTNLAQIISGTYDIDTNTLIFTRSDETTFSIDASMFFDDTNLVTSVNSKTGAVVLSTTDIAEGTNKYYTEARVSANSNVATNTSKISFDTAASTKLGTIAAGAQVNAELASKLEAEAGTDNVKTMTPLRVAEAIAVAAPPAETLTTLSLTANVLKYTDENATETDIDLSLYLDDTNLSKIISGVYDSGTTSLIFTRDDESTFSIDASMFFDDTNLVTSVNGKVGIAVLGTDDIAEGVTNLYYTEARVSANTDVAANKAAVAALDETHVPRSLVNGTFAESFDAIVNVTTTIDMTLEQSGGGDLTMQFSDGNFTLDCTPAQSIQLTPGSATIPQSNYIYVLQSTKALTKSTTGWPTAEHIRVAFVYCLDTSYTSGTLINQNWNDHLSGTNNMGHLTHVADWIRKQGAKYFSGINGIGSDGFIDIVGSAAYWKTSAGVVTQLHPHTFLAKDTSLGDDLHVINHPVTPYLEISDLSTLTVDSENVSLNNRFFNLVFWGVANKGGTYDPIMVNLPSGSYSVEANAIDDTEGYDNAVIPREYTLESGTGFLIAKVTVKISAGVLTVYNTVDLRGRSAVTEGSGSTSGTSYDNPDTLFNVYDTDDITRKVTINAGSISTGNTRIITMADANVNLADIAVNNAKVGYTEELVSANTDVAANTAKVGYTEALVTANIAADLLVAANTAKVGITTQQASDIATNNAKITYNSTDSTKVGHITVTQPVNLDTIETRVNALDTAVVLSGSWDASSGTFPTSTVAGETWIVSVAGTVDGVVFNVNDRVLAITDAASTTVYANNWLKADYTDNVLSVNSKVGAVVLDTDDVAEGTTNKYYTEVRVAANSAVAANTAKVGITTQQASDISTNNAKVGYTDTLVSANLDVVSNTSKISFDSTSSTKLGTIESGAQVNVALASQAEAEAGTEATKTMTPLQTAQAIAALAGGGASSLNELSDVTITSPTDNQFLRNNGTAFVNETVTILAAGNYTTSLPTTGWTGSVAPFTYAATVSGILSTDLADVDLDLSSSDYADVADIEASYSAVYRAVSSADTVTFYASAVPTIACPIKIKVVR